MANGIDQPVTPEERDEFEEYARRGQQWLDAHGQEWAERYAQKCFEEADAKADEVFRLQRRIAFLRKDARGVLEAIRRGGE